MQARGILEIWIYLWFFIGKNQIDSTTLFPFLSVPFCFMLFHSYIFFMLFIASLTIFCFFLILDKIFEKVKQFLQY